MFKGWPHWLVALLFVLCPPIAIGWMVLKIIEMLGRK